MDHVLTIRSTPDQGGLIEITIEISGPDTTIITVRTWRPGSSGPPDKPAKIDVQHLFDVRVSPSKSSLTCRASAPGMTPDSTNTYPLADVDYQALLTFIANSGYPPDKR